KFSQQAKHSSGVVTPDKFGDYGIARGTHGRLQANGITFDSTGHNVTTSLRLTETSGFDKMGRPFVVAVDSENNPVYRQDSKGLHIFAGDGTYTVANGSVRFDRKDAGKAVPKAPELHDIRIVGHDHHDPRLSKR